MGCKIVGTDAGAIMRTTVKPQGLRMIEESPALNPRQSTPHRNESSKLISTLSEEESIAAPTEKIASTAHKTIRYCKRISDLHTLMLAHLNPFDLTADGGERQISSSAS